ncbi:cupin domain-containing protein [Brucella haematophila]|uniref:Cupin domain-containing protein n=1 Tax=Brucella haematophila TaxID=419474 RepID=A0ABX1DPQ4_9HYPH|nr:cupin domain-containing protein [Brucella haematophila]NKC04932.1 cupin domain-containing protein [Brucella haematophila]TMV04542.1 cupin domain-containing protein [Brucella haematophila]
MSNAIYARRVVSGHDRAGKSIVLSDAMTASRVATDAFTINQIWQVDQLPPHVLVEDSSVGEVSIAPPVGGFVYLVTTFPPDASWDFAGRYKDALAASGGANAHVEASEIPGMHETDTVDIITVISGEIYAVLEAGGVCLKAGDSFVQRGTRHTWSNRTHEPCTIVAVMMGAHR